METLSSYYARSSVRQEKVIIYGIYISFVFVIRYIFSTLMAHDLSIVTPSNLVSPYGKMLIGFYEFCGLDVR